SFSYHYHTTIGSGPDRLADRDDVHHSVAAVEGGEDFLGRVVAAKVGDGFGADAVARQVHAAEQRVAAPGAGELVGALVGNEVVAPQRRRDVLLIGAFLPGEPRRLVLRVVLEEGEEDAELHVVVGELLDLGHAVGDQ